MDGDFADGAKSNASALPELLGVGMKRRSCLSHWTCQYQSLVHQQQHHRHVRLVQADDQAAVNQIWFTETVSGAWISRVAHGA